MNNFRTERLEQFSPQQFLKHVVAFANTRGGYILIPAKKLKPKDYLDKIQRLRVLIKTNLYSKKLKGKPPSIILNNIYSVTDCIYNEEILIRIKIKKGENSPYKVGPIVFKSEERQPDEDPNNGKRKIYIRDPKTKSITYRRYRELKSQKDFFSAISKQDLEEYKVPSKFKNLYNKYPAQTILFYNDKFAKQFDHVHLEIKDEINDIFDIRESLIENIPNRLIETGYDTINIKGSLYTQYKTANTYLNQYAKKFRPEPELLLNAIIHRNYGKEELIQIQRTNRLLKITSPGGFDHKNDINNQIEEVRTNPGLYEVAKRASNIKNSHDLRSVINKYSNEDYLKIEFKERFNSITIQIRSTYTKNSVKHGIVKARKMYILKVCRDNPLSRSEIYKELKTIEWDLFKENSFVKAYLTPLRKDEMLKYTKPNRRSRNQKYLTTKKGISEYQTYEKQFGKAEKVIKQNQPIK